MASVCSGSLALMDAGKRLLLLMLSSVGVLFILTNNFFILVS